jgi:hypothetical protein
MISYYFTHLSSRRNITFFLNYFKEQRCRCFVIKDISKKEIEKKGFHYPNKSGFSLSIHFISLSRFFLSIVQYVIKDHLLADKFRMNEFLFLLVLHIDLILFEHQWRRIYFYFRNFSNNSCHVFLSLVTHFSIEII